MMVFVARWLSQISLDFHTFFTRMMAFSRFFVVVFLLREVVSFIGLYGCYRNLPPLPGVGRRSMKC